MNNSQFLHIIYTDAEMLISKCQYASWQEIQDAFPDFKTSLGPLSVEEVIGFLADEYPTLQPDASVQVAEFMVGSAMTCVIRLDTASATG